MLPSISNKGSDAGQSSQYRLHRNRHSISLSLLSISQQPLSVQGIVQLVMVLEFRSSIHPNTLLYASSNPVCKSCASSCVNNLRFSFQNVSPSVPILISGFSTLLQIVRVGRGGGTTCAALRFVFVTTNPPTSAAAAITHTNTATVVAVNDFIPNGPTGATTAAPPALPSDAHDEARC